jgi:hypothetical protein
MASHKVNSWLEEFGNAAEVGNLRNRGWPLPKLI